MRSEYLYLGTDINPGLSGQIDHRHIHTYLAALLNKAFRAVELTLVGKTPEKSVRISVRDDSYARCVGSFKYTAVTYLGTLRINLDRADYTL